MSIPAKAGRGVARAGRKTPPKTPDAQIAAVPQLVSDVRPATITALASQSRRPAVIAAALGVTRAAFLEALKADPVLAEAYEAGRDLARDAYIQRLERSAFDRKGRCRNVTLAIWLGKIVHGFTETSGQQSPAPPGKHIHFHMPAPMTMEELRALNGGAPVDVSR